MSLSRIALDWFHRDDCCRAAKGNTDKIMNDTIQFATVGNVGAVEEGITVPFCIYWDIRLRDALKPVR